MQIFFLFHRIDTVYESVLLDQLLKHSDVNADNFVDNEPELQPIVPPIRLNDLRAKFDYDWSAKHTAVQPEPSTPLNENLSILHDNFDPTLFQPDCLLSDDVKMLDMTVLLNDNNTVDDGNVVGNSMANNLQSVVGQPERRRLKKKINSGPKNVDTVDLTEDDVEPTTHDVKPSILVVEPSISMQNGGDDDNEVMIQRFKQEQSDETGLDLQLSNEQRIVNGLRSIDRRQLMASMDGKFQCDECDYSTNYKSNLHNHRRVHSGVKSFKCDVCRQAFTFKKNLHTHMRVHSKLLQLHRMGCKRKCYECNFCRLATNMKIRLTMQRQRRKQTREDPFQCPHCTKRFTFKMNLFRHMKRTHM